MTSTSLSTAALMEAAAAPISEIVRSLPPDRLGAPTPCADFDVHDLLHHLLLYGPMLEAAARKESADLSTEPDLVVDDWASTLDTQIRALAGAWSDPAAWAGETRILGPSPVPASMIGGMVVTELVVHGWDLGTALGVRPEWDATVTKFAHDQVAATAEMGRNMGAYQQEHPVPPTAPTLHRLLGLTGRDPGWSH